MDGFFGWFGDTGIGVGGENGSFRWEGAGVVEVHCCGGERGGGGGGFALLGHGETKSGVRKRESVTIIGTVGKPLKFS